MDEIIPWEDKLPTCDDGQRDWCVHAGEILDSLNDESVESDLESDNEACDEAESYVEIPGILTSMEYLSKVKKLVLHKGYTEVLSDITAIKEKLENLF